jgi:hypothetical protein
MSRLDFGTEAGYVLCITYSPENCIILILHGDSIYYTDGNMVSFFDGGKVCALIP